jgi:hypothetical protein
MDHPALDPDRDPVDRGPRSESGREQDRRECRETAEPASIGHRASIGNLASIVDLASIAGHDGQGTPRRNSIVRGPEPLAI